MKARKPRAKRTLKKTAEPRIKKQEPAEVEQVLNKRAERYGKFDNLSKIAQMLKDVMRSEEGWDRLTYPQREALDMIAHKISRMLNGDPTYEDSVVDILGYADLMLRCMRGKDVL